MKKIKVTSRRDGIGVGIDNQGASWFNPDEYKLAPILFLVYVAFGPGNYFELNRGLTYCKAFCENNNG